MRRILWCVLFAYMTSAPLTNAQDQTSRLAQLSELSLHGQVPQLIQTATSLLANENLSPRDQSIVFTYLGHGYQRLGDLHSATQSFQKALSILDHDGHYPADYATTLASLATMYAEMGQGDTARPMLLRSVHILEKDGDHHAEIAWIWNDLATIAADQNSRRAARKCMARSITEAQQANVSSDESAALLTTQARIAELDGDPRTAIADYQHALALWKQSHEDQQTETAWLYVLLGRAYLEAGDIASARQTTALGFNLIEANTGPRNPWYVAAKLAYSKVLDASGSHDQASKLRTEAQEGMQTERNRAQSEIGISALH